MTCSFAKEFSISSVTNVENEFILQYIPIADGDSVRVYLYGLFLCNHQEIEKDVDGIAEALSLSTEKVKDAFHFWEEFGLVSVVSEQPLTVQYLSTKSASYSKPRKLKAEKYGDFTKGVQSLLSTRMVSTNEYVEYFNIMETFGMKPEAMLMIIKYCIDKKGTSIGYHYVSKVTKDFGARGLVTVDLVEKELSSYLLKTNELEKILKALSSRRTPDIEDLNYYSKWTKELGFESENVIFAAKTLKKGSMEKLDGFLKELYASKAFSKEEIEKFSNKKQEVYQVAIKVNKALSIYVDVIETEVSTYISKWLSYGFEESALLFIATHCFTEGKNTLKFMDELIETLRQKGYIDLSSVGDYFALNKKTDEFISKMLVTCGLNRRPTAWDRENVTVWKSWNFSEDMILEASKLASGKNSPIAYMNGVLSNWKNKQIFTLPQVENVDDATNGEVTQEQYNREYENRRANALLRAQKNVDTAMEIQDFAGVYERLFGIEKDLAFAEINDNKIALIELEIEKKTLTLKAETLLKTKKLTLDSLSPHYLCEKCNDTGYVGTRRCDCFNKK